jgi:Alr-MurF fusion protein
MQLNFTLDSLHSLLDAFAVNPGHLAGTFPVKNLVIDTRVPSISENTLFVALTGGKEDGHQYLEDFYIKGGRVAIVRMPVPDSLVCQLVVKDPLEALQKIAATHRSRFHIPVVAITGSNGKTIVKEWLYHVLKDNFAVVRSPKSYNSQIGVALSLLEISKDHTLGIFEAGISFPGEMAKLEAMIKPTVGIFTNIGDAHSASFDSIEQKKQEKYQLFRNTSKVITNSPAVQTSIPFSDEASLKNAALVREAALHFGLNENAIAAKLATLPAVTMRLEQLEGKNNCVILNDAYSADLHSLEIALKELKGITRHDKKVLFLTPLEENISDEVKAKLQTLIPKNEVQEIVFIGARDYLPELGILVHDFNTVDEFLQSGLRYQDCTILLKGSRKSGLEKIVQRLAERKHVTRLNINFSALRNNLAYFRSKISPATRILVMVKAHSYGGGLTEMAHFLSRQKVNYFGVAYADEGVQLRKSGITLPILVMNPEQNAFDELVEYNLEPSIYSPESLNAFISYLVLNQKRNYPIHIKLDTGMNRLGFSEEQLGGLMDMLQTQPEVYVKSAFSHLAAADDQGEKEYTYKQLRRFDIMTGTLKDRLGYPFDLHIANSAGALNFERAEYDMIRIGIGIFGLLDKTYNQLENVLSLTTQISQIKRVKAGESVGYGRNYNATHDHNIGIIPVGYADGLRRGLSQGKWCVIVHGKKAPIVGNICMDMCMIDLDGIDARTGDEVEVFGNENPIFEMAENVSTIPYEIIAGISSRVHRVYVEE